MHIYLLFLITFYYKINDFRYILILEDDALVVPQFDKLLDSLVTQLEDRPEVDYVKMYHPTKLRKIPSIPMVLSTFFSL